MNCLLTGIGGQGTVFASKLISQSALARGEHVRTAETIGMAQRGGSVVSHVRSGDGTFSPLLVEGSADVIIAFEPGEAARVVRYLAPGGVMVVNSVGQQSAADALTKKSYHPEAYVEALKKSGVSLIVVDGDDIARELGSSKVLNVALVGAACGSSKLNLSYDLLEQTIRKIAPQKFIELNISALKLGFEHGKSANIN